MLILNHREETIEKPGGEKAGRLLATHHKALTILRYLYGLIHGRLSHLAVF